MSSPIITGGASGSYLKATIGSSPTDLPETMSWEADTSGSDVLDVTTGGDQGYTNTAIGAKDLKVTLKLVFDLSAGATNWAALTLDTYITSLKLYTKASDSNPRYHLTKARVIANPIQVAVRDKITYTVVVKNCGPWTEA